MAEEKAPESVAAAPASGGGGKLVPILTIVNVLATVAMATILMMSFQRDKKQPTVDDIAASGEHAAPAEGGHGAAKAEGGHGGGGEHGEAKKPMVSFGKMIKLDQFTVNLATPGSANPKFARVIITVEVSNDDAESEVTQKMPQVRNAVIDLFNSKRPADLAHAEGRDYLKEEIRNALNSFMVTGKVKNVFFENFALTG